MTHGTVCLIEHMYLSEGRLKCYFECLKIANKNFYNCTGCYCSRSPLEGSRRLESTFDWLHLCY